MSAAESAVFVRPKALDEVLAQLAAALRNGRQAMLLAGGTDAMVERHMNGARWGDSVIDVTAVPELQRVERVAAANGKVRYVLGAGVTYWTLRTHPTLSRDVPLLAAMARDVGAVQIQMRGTLGGNLATGSPAADGVPALCALGATLHLASAAGGTRRVALESFYTGYRKSVLAAGEMIAAVEFDAPGGSWFWRKVGTRMAQSIAKVALAATAKVERGVIADARFGMASVSATTALLPALLETLRGRKPDEVDERAIAAALAKDITPIDDVRSTGEYRRHVAERLVLQFVGTLRAGS